jgi:hypothetical protein
LRGIVAGWQIETDSIPVGRNVWVDFLHGIRRAAASLANQFVIRFANGRSEIVQSFLERSVRITLQAMLFQRIRWWEKDIRNA